MTDLAEILERLKRQSGLQAMFVFADGSARVVFANRVLSFASAQELSEYAADDGCEFHI